jgi:adenylate kinase
MSCDHCNGQLYQRSDDNETTIRTRLGIYNKEVSSLIEFYEKEGKLIRLSADGEAGIVLEKIIELAKKRLAAA